MRTTRFLAAAAIGIVTLSGLALTTGAGAASAATTVPYIVPYFYGDSCGGTVLTDSSDSPNAAITKVTLNGQAVSSSTWGSVTVKAGDVVIVSQKTRSASYLFANGKTSASLQPTPRIPATADPNCKNVSPVAKTISLKVAAGKSTYVDLFNPTAPKVTDADGDPLDVFQVTGINSGKFSFPKRTFGSTTRQVIYYTAAAYSATTTYPKVYTGQYLVEDSYTIDGQPYHHLVPAKITVTVTAP